jgi:hypothetical protein
MFLALPAAHAGLFTETFEGYTAGTNVNSIGNGWGASSNNVTVVAAAFTNGGPYNQVAAIAPAQTLSNQVATTGARIWSDFWVNGTNFMIPDSHPPVNTASVFMVSVATNGYLYACNPTSSVWEVCLTDATNGPVGFTVSTGQWVRISVFQNYGNHTVAIFLNDRLIRKDWPFINTNLTTYNTLKFEGAGDGALHVDNVFVSNSTPQGLVSDSNGNKMPDALELSLYGALNVWTGSTITATVVNPAGGTVSPAGAVTGILYQDATNFIFSGSTGYGVGTTTTNGVLSQSYNNDTKAAAFNWTGITTDGTFQVGFVYNGLRYVPGDHSTLSGAVAAAQAGDRIVVSNGLYNESVTLTSNLTLMGTTLTGLVSFSVLNGVTNTLQGFTDLEMGTVTVETNGVLVMTGSVVTITSLTLGTNAFIYGTNSTLIVNGIRYTGNFTLDQFWNLSLSPNPLNFNDDFQGYSIGTRLDRLGPNGWNASTSSVTVVANPDATALNMSTRSAWLPVGSMASNLVVGAGLTNIWTDLLIRGSALMENPDTIKTNGAEMVMFYISTNGYLTVLTPSGWDVCSNDFWHNPAPTISAGEWAQVTWFMDFGKTQVTYFVKGHLVRQGTPFAHSASRYNSLKVDVNGAATWIDMINIQTNVPTGMISNWPSGADSDQDGTADAWEIQMYGDVNVYPCGSVFKIR